MKNIYRLLPIFSFLTFMILGFITFQGCEQFQDEMDPGSCIYHYQATDPGNSDSAENAEWGDKVEKRWYTAACIEYNVDEYSADLAKTSCLRSDDKYRVNRKKFEIEKYRQKDTDVPTEREYSYDKCNKTSLDGQSFKGKCVWNDVTVYYFENGNDNGGYNGSITNQNVCEDRKGSDGKVGVWYAP
jgi:hypothetical protein